MQKDRLCVAYYTIDKLSNKFQTSFNNNDLNLESCISVTEKAYLKDFIKKYESTNQVKLIITQSYFEEMENKSSSWQKLQEAIDLCRKTKAYLLIAELGSKSQNESFTKMLCSSEVDFVCCDQPFVNKEIIQALSKHGAIQKKIQESTMENTIKTTKVGNPNAAKLINKLNQPKVHAAIVYASFLQILQPGFKKNKLSQRKIVSFLNDNQFFAPEGGKWVLSQLQKVIDRSEWNDKAIEIKELFNDLKNNGTTYEKICEELNYQKIKSTKNTNWDAKNIKILEERISTLNRISAINEAIILVNEIIEIFNDEKLNPQDLILHFSNLKLELCKEFTPSQSSSCNVNPQLLSKLKALESIAHKLQKNDEKIYFVDIIKDVAKHASIYFNNIAPHISKINKILSTDMFGNKSLDEYNLPACLSSSLNVIDKFTQSNLITIDMLAHAISRVSKQPSILKDMVITKQTDPKSTIL